VGEGEWQYEAITTASWDKSGTLFTLLAGRLSITFVTTASSQRSRWTRATYALCSVAVDLRIHEVVDAPNWVVGAFLPDNILTGGGER
jgi:acetamidase/formamidase